MAHKGLSREAVIDAALAIADDDGVAALSMRRLGAGLGVEAMSLYNHVAGRDDLLAAIAERAWLSAPIGTAAAAHPWLLELPGFGHAISTRAGDPEALTIGRAWLARSQKGTTMFTSQTLATPDGPFSIIERDGVVVGAGWDAEVAVIARRAGIPADAITPGRCRSADAVVAYYAGDATAVAAVPVEPHGTPFRSDVWRALRQIPAGETRTYGEVAALVGSASASRAVGAACGSNAVGLFVPCHRVVGSSGKLTGFAWGVDTKRSLLQREGVAPRG